MPLLLSEVQTPLSRESIRTVLESLLTCLEFPVTAWQAESAARAFLEVAAMLGAEQSKPVAELAKMGFLDTATATFLDALLLSHYDETRLPAVASRFDITMKNSSTSNYPLTVGAVVVRSDTGRTFSNQTAPTLTAGTTQTVEVLAEVPGAAGNIKAQTLELVTPFAGVSAVFAGTFTAAGSDAESDPNARARARTKWATLRTEKISAGILNLVRTAVPAMHGISIDDENPRGPGTVDVYLAADTATAGVSDVATVQTALDSALFGTGTAVQAGLAIAAPTVTLNLAATVYTKGLNETDALNLLTAEWRAFLLTIPVGGFDLSPGPQNVVLKSQVETALSKITGVTAIDVTSLAESTAISGHTKVLEGTIAFTLVPVTEG